MFKVKSSTSKPLLNQLVQHRKARWIAGVSVIGLSGAAVASMAVTAPAQTAPNPVASAGQPVAAPRAVIPFDARQRLARLDALKAEYEELALKKKIAETKREIREADNPTPAAGEMGALPAMPDFGGGRIANMMPPSSLDTPPAPPRRKGGEAADGTGTALLEAWGIGTDRQARVRSHGNERVVRVGDRLDGGNVKSISSTSVSIALPNGKQKVIN